MFHKWIPGVADLDLLSVDIQRGRDIGISTYTKVREICNFPKITSFEDLTSVLSLDVCFYYLQHINNILFIFYLILI